MLPKSQAISEKAQHMFKPAAELAPLPVSGAFFVPEREPRSTSIECLECPSVIMSLSESTANEGKKILALIPPP